MISRRAVLGGSATVTLALVSGCVEFVLGEGPLMFDSERVAPSDAMTAETNYVERQSEQETMKERVGDNGEREIHASYWVSVYSKAVQVGTREQDAAVFAAVSMPGIRVLDKPRNPLLEMERREIIDEFEDDIEREFDGLRNIHQVDSRVLTILEQNRTVDRFRGETEIEGETVELDIWITLFVHEGDVLVLLGVHPRLLPNEGVNIEKLMETIEHPLD